MSDSVACRVDDETSTRIEDFREQHGYDKKGDAVRALLLTGLREQHAPILFSWRENAIQASHYLMIAAIVFAVIGVSPAAFDWQTGVWMGGALVLVGLALVAVVEAARTVRGANEIGEGIRGERV